ncbi:MAG: sugar phosphate nucleotidyltransferase [Flavobacteriales bacterium]|jgi:dTDP-glucose pyrophosphorylase|nr:sugar phosphate nucleotidyltransferase [Flavobacteriales bacterium]
MSEIKPTLVVLAAGMGSRYGGLKQLDTFTESGATIIDFSIYDALDAGFEKFVFIIRRSFEEEFKTLFSKKLEGRAQVDFVFQETEKVPEKYLNPKRTKPWGTAHALLMAKDVLTDNFAIINADDFYGKEAFRVMADTLRKTDRESYQFNMMAYLLKNTISEHGFVSRGECQVDDSGFLTDVTERVHIEKVNGQLIRKDEHGSLVPIDENTIVSMNFWGFTLKYFEFGVELFEEFLEENREDLKAEFYIPSVVQEILKSGKATVEVLKSNAKWFGVTYKEDKEMVSQEIDRLFRQKIYPSNLW